MKKLILVTTFILSAYAFPSLAVEPSWPDKVRYHYQEVLGQKLFYRESGVNNPQTIVLLHGYPSSSHTYRELIPLLSGRYHVIAPDYIGSGYSAKPNPSDFTYDFDVLSQYVSVLLEKLGAKEFVLYMQDYGAPVGFRLMMKNPDKIQAVIAQNANAYLAGIPPAIQEFTNSVLADQSDANVSKLYALTSPEAVKDKQYLRDVQDRIEIMSPDTWIHDGHFLSTDLERRIQLKLIQDYKTNLESYPAWQQFLRKHQPPTLLVWGERDPVFTADGARAYLKDLPKAELHLIDAGHFAVEEKAVEIAQKITNFLGYEGHPGTIEKQLNESND